MTSDVEVYYENTSLWTSTSSICQSPFSQHLLHRLNMLGGNKTLNIHIMFCLSPSHLLILVLKYFWEEVLSSGSLSAFLSSYISPLTFLFLKAQQNILAFTQKQIIIGWSPLHFALTYILRIWSTLKQKIYKCTKNEWWSKWPNPLSHAAIKP